MLAPPITLVLAILIHGSPTGAFLQRTFFSMILHECGHALSAWICGYGAVPLLWVTPVSASRGWLLPLLFLGGQAFLLRRVLAARRWAWASLLGFGLLLVAIGTLGCSPHTARQVITFGGDGGAMVIATALMAGFFVAPDHLLARGAARWGLLVIGAGSFADVGATWWAARHDVDAIPFGKIEGVGLSDPSKLLDQFGWTLSQLIGRYVALGALCLIVLGGLWLKAIHEARRRS